MKGQLKYLLFAGVMSTVLLIGTNGYTQISNKSVDQKAAFTILANDSLEVTVQADLNKLKQPISYSSLIETPVCDDSLCHLVQIKLVWDLLGNFHRYEVPEDRPLTKFDHEEFTQKDHEKLYTILANTESPLRDYRKSDLIDHRVEIKSEIADAVSGATNATIKDDVIEGALYSTYTLWHIVNGNIAKEIHKRTETSLTPQLLKQMLHSESHHEQFYALTKLDVNDVSNSDLLLELILSGKAYVPLFAVQKLPVESWNSEKYQKQLFSALPELSFELQNEIINKLPDLTLSRAATLILENNLKDLKEQQQMKVRKVIQHPGN